MRKFKTDLIPITLKFLSCSIFGWSTEINVSVTGVNFAAGNFNTTVLKKKTPEISLGKKRDYKIHLLVATICCMTSLLKGFSLSSSSESPLNYTEIFFSIKFAFTSVIFTCHSTTHVCEGLRM